MGKKEKRGKDVRSLQRVKAFLSKLEGRAPTDRELRQILPHLQTLHLKIERLRRLSPLYRGVDVSEDVRQLFELAGLSARGVRRWRDAAAS